MALLGEVGERLPIDELHGNEVDPAFAPDAVHAHHVRVV